MRARTELAIIDHNVNVGREQKTTLEGKDSSLPENSMCPEQYNELYN